MPAASRVRLVPPDAWDEDRLVAAARALAAREAPVRPGDEVSGLVVVSVEPTPGAAFSEATEIEIVPRPRTRGAPTVDIVILLDRSESMGEPWNADHTRASASEEALRSFLRQPGAAVGQVTLMAYAKAPRLVAGPASPGELQLEDLPSTGGRSATAEAVNAALAHLAAHAHDDRCQAILMLTDGVGEVPELLLAADRAARLGVPIHAIVFAPETDEVFEEIAKRSGGSLQRAMLPLDIEFVHDGAE